MYHDVKCSLEFLTVERPLDFTIDLEVKLC